MYKKMAYIVNKPILLWLVTIILFAMISTLSYPIHYLFPDSETGKMFAEAIINLIIMSVFVVLVWRVWGIHKSGLLKIGDKKIWVITFLALLYLLPAKLYAFTGTWTFRLPEAKDAIAHLLYYMTGSMVEEMMYRGIVLTGMLLLWGQTKKGIIKSIVLSSILFGMLHLLNLMTAPVLEVLLQVLVVIVPGMFYAVLVKLGGSLWPVIVIHGLSNFVVNTQLFNMPNYEVRLYNWVLSAVFVLPLIVVNRYLIKKIKV